MKNIYVYTFIIGVILFIAGLWLSQRVEGFQGTFGVLLAGIGTGGIVYVADSGLTNSPNWSNISGSFTQISGSMGQIVGVNSSKEVWYTRQASPGIESTWKKIPGTATQVAFDFPKVLAVMGDSVGYISDVSVANPAFTMKNGPVGFKWIDISLGGSYAIGKNNKIYSCADITASNWSWTDITTGVIVGKTFMQLSCDGGNVAVVTESNELYYARDGRTWFQLTGQAVKGVAVRGGMLYALGTDNKIYYSPSQIPNASWSSLSGTVAFSYIDCILPINAQIISERTAGNASCENPTYELVGGQCMSPCPSGYTANGTTCVQGSTTRATRDATLPAEVTYNCPSGEIQLSGAVCRSTQDHTVVSNNAPPKEAYAVNGSFTQIQAQAKCESYGATLASYQQVGNAQAAGASWGSMLGLVAGWGWIADDTTNIGQISYAAGSATTVVPKQAGGTAKSGAICYGVKPPLSVAGGLRPFNNTKWNQADQCDFGYRVVFNASCKSSCPPESISDPTYCTYEAVPKTSKAKQNTNFTCPNGYDDPSVTSCSKFKYNDTTQMIECDTPAPTCYQSCPTGYTRNGTSCTKPTVTTQPRAAIPRASATTPKPSVPESRDTYCPTGYTPGPSVTTADGTPIGKTCTNVPLLVSVPVSSTKCSDNSNPQIRPNYNPVHKTCANGYRPVSSCPTNTFQTTQLGTGNTICYTSECPTGYRRVDRTCTNLSQSDAAARHCPPNYTLMGRSCEPNIPCCEPNIPCPDNYTLRNGSCEPNTLCPPDYTSRNGQCEPNTPCPSDYTLTNGRCVFNTTTTVASITARQTTPATFSPPCEPGYKIVGTACYKDCDTDLNDIGTKCQKPSIARTTSEITITKPVTPICADDEEIINKKCVKKCTQGNFSTDTSCSTASVARTVVAAKFTAPCNSNEDLLNGMCVSRCGPGESRVGSICVPGKQRVDSPFCRSSNYGNYKRWLCDTQIDLDKLLKDPSSTTTYVNDNDQVCITSSPTTMMYYCQTVAETNSGGDVLDDIQDVAGTTCSNLLKNYIDLSGSIVSLKLIQSGMNDGSISLVTAKDKLTAVYNKLQCNTNTTDLCTSIQTSVGKIGGNVTAINSTNSAISGPITQAVQARQDLLASIQKFQCSP